MFRFLKHDEIDLKRYDLALNKATNSLPYAQSWYLNIIAPKWCLITDAAYTFIMPVPVKRKYGLPYAFVPPWVQQLGVFSRESVSSQVIEQILNTLPKWLIRKEIILNYKNKCENQYITQRDNFVIDLNNSYEEIYANFSTSKKTHINSILSDQLTVKNACNAEQLITLFKSTTGVDLVWKEPEYDRLNKIALTGINRNEVLVKEVYTNDNELLGGAILLIGCNRVINLFSVTSSVGRQYNSNLFLINQLLKHYANSKMVFDFEGSMIPGVSHFFRSLGADNEPYWFYNKRLF